MSDDAPSSGARAQVSQPGDDDPSSSRPQPSEPCQKVGAPAMAASNTAAMHPRAEGGAAPDERLFFTAVARADFWCFVELMFPVLYPGKKLIYAPYLELIATVLMRVDQGAKRNVIINLPPRHMKSALVSVLYTAWRLGRDPTTKFICISYGDDLAHDLSSQTRKVMRSESYRRIFPNTVLDKTAVDHIRTTQGGYRYATAVGSDITGFGADEIIIDDPVQPEDVHSERVMQKVRDWVESSVRTRFNDPSKGAMVLVMHRLAPDDLSGTLEPHADFILKLPLIAEKREHYIYHDRDLMIREAGDPLNPARINREEVEKIKARIAPHVFEGQYQQRPRASTSGYCDISRLVRYAAPPPFEAIVHSWDIAATKGGGDWTVCARLASRATRRQGPPVPHRRLRFQASCPRSARRSSAKTSSTGPRSSSWTATASAGASTRTFGHEVSGISSPGESITTSATDNLKLRRFNEALFYLYDGFVLLPELMPGLDRLFDEMAAFPDGKHDDQVDALSTVAAYHPRVVHEARRLGRQSGRLKELVTLKLTPPSKSRDQELHDRRQSLRSR